MYKENNELDFIKKVVLQKKKKKVVLQRNQEKRKMTLMFPHEILDKEFTFRK